MNVEVQIIKGLPTKQIDMFEDKVIYNIAVLTREYTKSTNSYPYLTGTLQQTESSAPIIGNNKDYGLATGVDYAKKVWTYQNVNWSNPGTQPQWYATNFRLQGNMIINNAVNNALKEV